MPDAPFQVLAVCTGNICRSPAVERLLAQHLPAGSGVEVASAGLAAVEGAPISPPMADLLREAGADVEGFVARQVTPEMLRQADLVIALTRDHRSRLVATAPATVRRTFTLRELARLVGHVDPAALPAGTAAERFRVLLPLAAAQRGPRRAGADHDDVVDPYGGTAKVYARSWEQLRPAVDRIARVVAG